jgi:CDP-glucose 4,6-dehydratase
MGARVTGLALDPPSDPSMFDVAGMASVVADRRIDIRDFESTAQIFDESQPEIVFHLAAQALVLDGYREPVATFATNVMGTAHVLESIRRCPSVRAAVMVTSDKCYENDESGRAFSEGDRLGGHDPYSSSKACAEILTSSYWRSFLRGTRAAVATVRAGNVIGGGDWARDRLLPDLVRGFAGKRPTIIRNPSAVRPWQHVLEPLAGCMMLAERLAAGQEEFATAWNFGPADVDVRPVSYVAARAAAAWGSDATWESGSAEQPHEAHHLRLDSTRARERLQWQPRWSVDQAIDGAIAWYRAHESGENMYAYTTTQIESYARGTHALA